MKIIETNLPDVKLIQRNVFYDERGYFFESYNEESFNRLIKDVSFVQDNISSSKKGVLRGLHYQLPPFAQSKLVHVLKGKVLDVAVDIRKNSITFGQFVIQELSDENNLGMFIPRGFAHGYLALTDDVIFQYKVDNFYSKACESGIIYNDSTLNIPWPEKENLIISDKDKILPTFNKAELF